MVTLRTMKTYANMRDHTAPRQAVHLTRDQHGSFMRAVRRQDQTAAYLLYHWLVDGVRRARAGLPLPPATPEARVWGEGREWVKCLWKQGEAEHGAWAAELAAAGSSVTAVLRARVADYNAADGDPLATGTDPAAPQNGLLPENRRYR